VMLVGRLRTSRSQEQTLGPRRRTNRQARSSSENRQHRL
jgi:hypothetical protein